MTSSTTRNPELAEGLLDIGLRGLAATLDSFLERAKGESFDAERLLEELVGMERLDQSRRSLERRQKRAKIGSFKPIADFDWNWPETLDCGLVESVLKLRFIRDGANVILVGPHGLGKTMILKNIAHQAVLAGNTVLVVTAANCSMTSAPRTPHGGSSAA